MADALPQALPPCALSLEAQLFDALLAGRTLREATEALVAAGERKNAVKAAALRVKHMLPDAGDD